MTKIYQRPIQELAGLTYPCSCGRTHQVDIQAIRVGSGCIRELPDILRQLGASRIFMLADNHTYEAAGRQVEELLKEAGLAYHTRLFETTTPLVPNEYALGSALAKMETGDDLLLAVGSGTLNDLTKYISARTGVPYVIAATAPSMDGYASTVAPMILDGFKTTLPAVYPAAIVADVDILKDAPMPMLTAGFGDIIGKYTALRDWALSRQLFGEYYCEEAAILMEQALEKCANNAKGLSQRDPAAVEAVTEALILSGVAMGLVGNSRPASGAEHHMAHYWEMDALRRGEEHPLHGNAVGAAAVISASLYELAAKELPQGFTPPDKERIVRCLRDAGAAASPKELGIRRDLCLEALLHAMELRDRFTILRFLDSKGELAACAMELTNRFYET
ncbi:MAG: sn-glycerol-1-phosphate dehydrogenase [Acutalibacter sp.]|jgi:glycerol-1-phosphate dehydrogenase [NAD(P)+]